MHILKDIRGVRGLNIIRYGRSHEYKDTYALLRVCLPITVLSQIIKILKIWKGDVQLKVTA